MTRTHSLGLILTAASVAITGCGKPNAGPADMKPPPRPAELDRLDRFVGSWSGEGEMKMPGAPETMKSTSSSTSKWVCDKRYVMEDFHMKMGDEMEMSGMAFWGWNADEGKYQSWWFDSMGTTGMGYAKYDEKTDTWTMESKGTDPMSGKPSWGAGTIKFTDANSMEGTWKEWDNALKWGDAMEMTFKSTRK